MTLHKYNGLDNGQFNLRMGQMRSRELVHNGGWYDAAGNKLGWGDLSHEDMKTISAEIDPEDIFVILPESASFWDFVTKFGMLGSMCKVKPDEQAPGKDYIAEKCSWIIVKDVIYRVSGYEFNEWSDSNGIPQEKQDEGDRALGPVINRARAKQLIKGS